MISVLAAVIKCTFAVRFYVAGAGCVLLLALQSAALLPSTDQLSTCTPGWAMGLGLRKDKVLFVQLQGWNDSASLQGQPGGRQLFLRGSVVSCQFMLWPDGKLGALFFD